MLGEHSPCCSVVDLTELVRHVLEESVVDAFRDFFWLSLDFKVVLDQIVSTNLLQSLLVDLYNARFKVCRALGRVLNNFIRVKLFRDWYGWIWGWTRIRWLWRIRVVIVPSQSD